MNITVAGVVWGRRAISHPRSLPAIDILAKSSRNAAARGAPNRGLKRPRRAPGLWEFAEIIPARWVAEATHPGRVKTGSSSFGRAMAERGDSFVVGQS